MREVLSRPPRWLASLRSQVVLAVGLVTVAPVAFVVSSAYYERALETYLAARTDRALLSALVERKLPGRDSGVALVEVSSHGDEAIFGSTSDRKALALRARAHQGKGRRCSVEPGDRLHVCASWGTRADGALLYAEASDERSVRSLLDDRAALVKLTLLVLPGSLLLAFWLGRRMVRPLERLQKLVHERADEARPRADLPMAYPGEIGDLARSFNRLIERLLARQQANETFLQDLAHELKSPVAAVRAASERLESGEPLETERKLRLARVLRDSGQKLEQVMRDFLELASAEAGLYGEQRAEVDLGQLLEQLLERARLRHEALSFELHAEAGVSSCIVTSRVETALHQLLENAAHFANTKVVVCVDASSELVRISVEDDGPGIAPEHMARVFERFFTRRAGVGGTGLGLAIVRAVALAHEGDVTVQCTPGHGARFDLTLPRAKEARGCSLAEPA